MLEKIQNGDVERDPTEAALTEDYFNFPPMRPDVQKHLDAVRESLGHFGKLVWDVIISTPLLGVGTSHHHLFFDPTLAVGKIFCQRPRCGKSRCSSRPLLYGRPGRW